MRVAYFKDTEVWRRKNTIADSNLKEILDCASLPTQVSADQAVVALKLCHEWSKLKEFALHQIEKGNLSTDSVLYKVSVRSKLSETKKDIVELNLLLEVQFGKPFHLATLELPKYKFLAYKFPRDNGGEFLEDLILPTGYVRIEKQGFSLYYEIHEYFTNKVASKFPTLDSMYSFLSELHETKPQQGDLDLLSQYDHTLERKGDRVYVVLYARDFHFTLDDVPTKGVIHSVYGKDLTTIPKLILDSYEFGLSGDYAPVVLEIECDGKVQIYY